MEGSSLLVANCHDCLSNTPNSHQYYKKWNSYGAKRLGNISNYGIY